jgi:hypothetical protein
MEISGFCRIDFLGFYRFKSSVQESDPVQHNFFDARIQEKHFFNGNHKKSQINPENIQDSLQVKYTACGSKVGSDPDPIFWIH